MPVLVHVYGDYINTHGGLYNNLVFDCHNPYWSPGWWTCLECQKDNRNSNLVPDCSQTLVVQTALGKNRRPVDTF
jgi:hypothetical protein